MKNKLVVTRILLFLFIVANLILLNQNRQLRARLGGQEVERISVGDVLLDMRGVDMAGRPFAVEYDDPAKRDVLLFLSPQCRYCELQIPYWREVATRLDRTKFNLTAVVRQGEDSALVRKYLAQLGDARISVLLIDSATARRNKLTLTPLTLVASAGGVVEEVWPGFWNETTNRLVGRTLLTGASSSSDFATLRAESR